MFKLKFVSNYIAFLPVFTDTEEPKFANNSACKEQIVIRKQTLKGKSYAIINFEEIAATDNSGVPPTVTCVTESDQPCEYKMGVEYKFGIVNGEIIKFKATDKAGNFKYCRFQVFVEGMQLYMLKITFNYGE